MLVEEAGAFSGNQIIRIEVVNGWGDIFALEITNDLAIEKLKIMALAHFHKDPLMSIKMAQQYKLVSMNKKKSLTEEATVRDEDLSENDVLLLLPRNTKSEEFSSTSELKSQAPGETEISEATSHLIPRNSSRNVVEFPSNIDFQRELRKILISLIDYSEKLLRNHPEVYPIFRDIKYDTKCEEKNEYEGIDPEALKQLNEMGFPLEKAARALKLNNMSSIDAMDWLLAYEPVSSSTTQNNQAINSESTVSLNNVGLCPNVPAIVECYRAYKRRHFKPNTKALKGLRDMGFSENEILDALWIHTNNEVAACEWLLSDRRPKHKDLQCGLSKNSQIYKAIISNSVIQLGLVKPKVFFAFLQLVEEPNSTGRWLSDPETSPILSQVFRIYHSEKHALQTVLDATNNVKQ